MRRGTSNLVILHPGSAEENRCFAGVSPVDPNFKKKPKYFNLLLSPMQNSIVVNYVFCFMKMI